MNKLSVRIIARAIRAAFLEAQRENPGNGVGVKITGELGVSYSSVRNYLYAEQWQGVVFTITNTSLTIRPKWSKAFCTVIDLPASAFLSHYVVVAAADEAEDPDLGTGIVKESRGGRVITVQLADLDAESLHALRILVEKAKIFTAIIVADVTTADVIVALPEVENFFILSQKPEGTLLI